jgi:hypothetical protein
MGGSSSVQASKYVSKPDDTAMFSILAAKQATGGQYLQNQSELLKLESAAKLSAPFFNKEASL